MTLLDEFGEPETITSGAVVLATGGAGQLFSRTTNPAVATGDGLALAYRAGAQLMDLEFVQFHPTALAIPDLPSFLISEAVRGEGGILRDAEGRAFMGDFHPDRELAPRDVVARAIHQQMIRSNSPNVWLDITHLPVERVEARFPSILRFCRDHGIDPTREPIPVSPAAHYLMGGVRTDVWGRTSLPGLYACGEVACTGVHGANRLASNSLLEGLVFARRAVQSILRGDGGAPEMASGPRLTTAGFRVDTDPETPVSRPELAAVMWRHASLVRSAESLRQASAQIGWPGESPRPQAGGVRGTVAQHELANLTLLGRLILRAASLREESRGAHFRADFPTRDPAWQGHIVLSGDDAWLAEQQPIGAARG